MKEKHKIIFLFLTGLVMSCGSDQLSKSGAAEIIEKCIEKEKFNNTNAKIRLGKEVMVPWGKSIVYEQLVEEGMIVIGPKIYKMGTIFHNISLTKEGLEHKIEDTESGALMKGLTIKFSEVVEIREVPSENAAIVKANFQVMEKTPFFKIESTDKKYDEQFIPNTFQFRKTTDGWKFCE